MKDQAAPEPTGGKELDGRGRLGIKKAAIIVAGLVIALVHLAEQLSTAQFGLSAQSSFTPQPG